MTSMVLDENGEPVITLDELELKKGPGPLKVSRLWERVQEVAQERPDHIYPRNRDLNAGASCSYERGGEPSCLVGHALVRCGVSVEILKKFDRVGSSDFETLLDVYPDLFEVDDEGAGRMVALAQHEQDQGKTWGEAIK